MASGRHWGSDYDNVQYYLITAVSMSSISEIVQTSSVQLFNQKINDQPQTQIKTGCLRLIGPWLATSLVFQSGPHLCSFLDSYNIEKSASDTLYVPPLKFSISLVFFIIKLISCSFFVCRQCWGQTLCTLGKSCTAVTHTLNVMHF